MLTFLLAIRYSRYHRVSASGNTLLSAIAWPDPPYHV